MFEGFRTSISAQRLDIYRSKNSTDLEVLTYCLFNTAVSESFYSPLQFLEVGLRNAMHDALTFSNNNPRWYKLPFMCDQCKSDIEEAENKLTADGKDANDPGRVVAELKFGFWARLFNKHYQIPLWNNKAFLIRTFPYAKSQERLRHKLAARIDLIRRFRNRIFHHERILGYDLHKYHGDITEIIGWISSDLVIANNAVDRFKGVFSGDFFRTLKRGLRPHVRRGPSNSN
jgi:hypothetical protein